MRDHGGNIDAAIARFGGDNWIDLSTGINREPYPVPDILLSDWTMLPTHAAKAAVIAAARKAYGTQAPMLAVAGAQAAIQMIPRVLPIGCARVLGPTYNEHAAALRNAGWQVEQVDTFDALAGADLAVVVNPNNPDGNIYNFAQLLELSEKTRLLVDESFADMTPDVSVAAHAGQNGLMVLRSFGKFFGLAGMRLGFVLGGEADIAALSDMAGPWPVNGAALRIAQVALADEDWADATTRRLNTEVLRADALAQAAGWSVVGGTGLFRLYDTGDARAAQERLARHQIWSRIFPYSERWVRLGLPGGEAEWARFATAMEA